MGTIAKRSTCLVGWGSQLWSGLHQVLLDRGKRDFPSKTYRKNTHPLMRIAVVLSNLCHAYGIHSELLRSAFQVLSTHMHTTSTSVNSTRCRRSRICNKSQHGGLYIFEACFNSLFFRSYNYNGRIDRPGGTRSLETSEGGA